MKYKVEVPGYAEIGTASNMSELVGILKDGDCIKKMTIEKLCEIADGLSDGMYVGKFNADPRFNFVIRKDLSL